jgi:16S rRNA G966 N2-methylase RsmD
MENLKFNDAKLYRFEGKNIPLFDDRIDLQSSKYKLVLDTDNKKIDKSRDIKTLLRLFPYLEDKSKASRLKIDIDSIYYISIREHAEQISLIIYDYLEKIGIEPSNAYITDATAGVGGNTISFGRMFKFINAIEIDKKRSDYLTNNLEIYELNNIGLINDDCTKILHEIENQDVIFIDPPWGGKSYKNYTKLKLRFSNITLEMLCNNIFDKNITKCTPKLLILKLPTNYDVTYFYKMLKIKTIFLHNLGKMFIIVIINTDKVKINTSSNDSDDDDIFLNCNNIVKI